MTTIFDGMAGALNATFGAPVTIKPGGGEAVSIHAVVREERVELADGEGEAVLGVQPILMAMAADVTALVEGDLVEQGSRQWRVRYRVPGESPAGDRFETFVLRKDEE
jgi:hypothetical protein